jgi:hypothetical protein
MLRARSLTMKKGRTDSTFARVIALTLEPRPALTLAPTMPSAAMTAYKPTSHLPIRPNFP